MAGIVLAGGKSVRMGHDKALLPYGGRALLDHVIGIVSQVVPTVIVVADRQDRYALEPAVDIVADLYPDAGPLGGIVTGLTHVEEGCHVVVACDMPHLAPDVLQLLLDAAKGFDAAVPVVAGRLEPLCAVYHTRCGSKLEAMLKGGCLALHQAIRALYLNCVNEERLRRIDPALACFTNVNAPADWLAVQKEKGI